MSLHSVSLFFIFSRKRWFNKTDNHSLADEDLSGLSQPVAKKSRPHSVRDQLTNNLTPHKVVGIKRSNVASSLSTETLSKKPTLVTKRNRYVQKPLFIECMEKVL